MGRRKSRPVRLYSDSTAGGSGGWGAVPAGIESSRKQKPTALISLPYRLITIGHPLTEIGRTVTESICRIVGVQDWEVPPTMSKTVVANWPEVSVENVCDRCIAFMLSSLSP